MAGPACHGPTQPPADRLGGPRTRDIGKQHQQGLQIVAEHWYRRLPGVARGHAAAYLHGPGQPPEAEPGEEGGFGEPFLPAAVP
jgi:hypothetical protein